MIWAGIVVITFAIAVRIYPIFIFLLKERIKPLVEALYDKLLWIWEVSLSRTQAALYTHHQYIAGFIITLGPFLVKLDCTFSPL